MSRPAWPIVSLLFAALPPMCSAAETSLPAADSLRPLTDPTPDTQTLLDAIAWQRGAFTVRWDAAPEGRESDRIVKFPSPWASGDAVNDVVHMDWYAAKDEAGNIVEAPAVLVIHESGSAMPAGKLAARGLRSGGLHAFLIHLPYYGDRRRPGERPDPAKFLETMRQGITDVRRGRDAIAVLPDVDESHIAVQGTSLGGFVATSAASLDRGFDSVFITLAGGDLYGMVQNGKQDTAKLREQLARAGYTGEKLRELLWAAEPTRLAHRLDPAVTWMYSGRDDDVVPFRNACILAEAAGLDRSHHIDLVAGHYTAALYFPVILDHMTRQIAAVRKSATKNP